MTELSEYYHLFKLIRPTPVYLQHLFGFIDYSLTTKRAEIVGKLINEYAKINL